MIKDMGIKVGILFNLGMLIEVVCLVLDLVDFIFVMIVNLGFGG